MPLTLEQVEIALGYAPPPRVDWYGMAIATQMPTWALGEPGLRLAPSFRHAKHVGRPHPECEVCRAKGRV